MKTCDTCAWWVPLAQGDEGECRARAPRPTLSNREEYLAMWPTTHQGDGCGEHRDPVPETPRIDSRPPPPPPTPTVRCFP